MKVFIPNISNISIGGGWTFYRNFLKAAERFPEIEMVTEDGHPDILFAFSPTTVSGEIIARAKAAGTKFVLRLDGVPEDSRNSGHGTSRLIEFAKQADLLIYQSHFIDLTLGPIIRAHGITTHRVIIHNGVDTSIFTPEGSKITFHGKPKILHVAYRKDPNKRYEEVVAMYREYFRTNTEADLILVGRYPTEWIENQMGFFSGERIQYLGVKEGPDLAMVMRSCDFLFYPSFADPAPNVVLEALGCGLPVLYNAYGGTGELVGDRILKQPGAGNFIRNEMPYRLQIEALLADRESASARARVIAAENDIHTMMINYKSAFEILLGI